MRATTAFGKVGNFPVRGTVVNIESTDIAPLVHAAGTAIKVITLAGVAIAATALLRAVINATNSAEKAIKFPMSAFAHIQDIERNFMGVNLDKEFSFISLSNRLSVPIHLIERIYQENNYHFPHYTIDLVDGSSYLGVKPITTSLTFISLVGKQRVDLTEKKGRLVAPHSIRIEGTSSVDIDALRTNLRHAVESTRETIIKEFGEDL